MSVLWHSSLDHASFFQQDNARPHTSRVTTEALRGISVVDWAARSPDMSPIENLRDELGRRVRHQYEDPPATIFQLQQRLVEQWGKIEIPTIKHLLLGMSRRIAELVRRKGRHTRYLIQF